MPPTSSSAGLPLAVGESRTGSLVSRQRGRVTIAALAAYVIVYVILFVLIICITPAVGRWITGVSLGGVFPIGVLLGEFRRRWRQPGTGGSAVDLRIAWLQMSEEAGARAVAEKQSQGAPAATATMYRSRSADEPGV